MGRSAIEIASTLRAPYRSRAVVRSGASERLDEARLGRAMTVTQLVLLALCAARVASDLVRGALGLEGNLALALLIVFATSLVSKAIG